MTKNGKGDGKEGTPSRPVSATSVTPPEEDKGAGLSDDETASRPGSVVLNSPSRPGSVVGLSPPSSRPQSMEMKDVNELSLGEEILAKLVAESVKKEDKTQPQQQQENAQTPLPPISEPDKQPLPMPKPKPRPQVENQDDKRRNRHTTFKPGEFTFNEVTGTVEQKSKASAEPTPTAPEDTRPIIEQISDPAKFQDVQDQFKTMDRVNRWHNSENPNYRPLVDPKSEQKEVPAALENMTLADLIKSQEIGRQVNVSKPEETNKTPGKADPHINPETAAKRNSKVIE